MKVEVNKSEKKQIKAFPKLMIATEKGIGDTGIIVLFTKESIGVVIYTPTDYRELGYASNDFYMDCFEDFNGSITLSND